MISPEHNIIESITIMEGNVIDMICLDVLEIHTVLKYHCATYSVQGHREGGQRGENRPRASSSKRGFIILNASKFGGLIK